MKKALAILLSLIMVLSLAACSNNSGTTEPAATSGTKYVYTDNYGFTEGEMAYLYNYVYSQSASYLSYLGVDTTKSLKEQKYSEDTTWFDYMMQQAVNYAKDFLLFCEDGKARGITLDDEDTAKINEELAAVDKAAKDGGFDSVEAYFKKSYGASMTKADYENFLQKSALAYKVYADITGGYTFTDDQIQEHYDSNKNEFMSVDFLTYSFTKDDAKNITDEDATKSAQELAAVTSADDFKAYVKNYIESTATEEAKATLDIDAELAKLQSLNVKYTQGDEVSEWAFADAAKVNQTFTTANADSGVHTVYLLTKTPTRNDNETVNVRHILLTATTYGTDEDAKAFADNLVSQWKAGDATEDSFAALATQYTEDTGSKTNGGLYENVAPGEMVAPFNDWIFDASRKAGDVDVVKTDYGYHVMYFVKNGAPVWKNDVTASMKQIAYGEDYSKLSDAYPITVENDLLNKIGE